MHSKSNSFNIVICPPDGISDKAIRVSKTLKFKGGLFVLDKKNYFPHVSLYMTEFPVKNLPKIKKLLQQIVVETKSFKMTSTKYEQNKRGSIAVDYRKSKNIKWLQKKIIGSLNPLREGLVRKKDRAKMHELSRAQQKNVKLYGYRRVGVEFNPHLTFTTFEKFNKAVIQIIPKINFSFKAEEIGFLYLGNHGTCKKFIARFKLGR